MAFSRRRALILGAIGLSVLAIVAGAWSARLGVAGHMLKAVAAGAGHSAELRVTALNLGRIELANVRLGPSEAPHLTAQRIDARFRLAELFGGRLAALSVQNARAEAAWTPAGLTIAGFALAPAPDGTPPPRVALEDVTLAVDTALGPAEIALSAEGDARAGWRLDASLAAAPPQQQPQIADSDAGDAGGEPTPPSFTVEAGRLSARLAPEAAQISLDLTLTDAQGPQLSAAQWTFSAAFVGVMPDPAQLASLAGEGQASLALRAMGLEADAAGGVAQAWVPGAPPPLDRLVNPHLLQARAAIDSALRRFDADMDAAYTVSDGVMDVTLSAPMTVTGANGVAAQADVEDGGLIRVDLVARSWEVRRARAEIAGEGAPSVMADVAAASFNAEGRRRLLIDSDLRMAPWDAEGVAAGMELDLLRLDAGPRDWSIAAAGRAAFDGRRGDIALRGAGIAADLEIMGEDRAVSVIPRDGAAPRITIQDGVIAGVALRDLSMRVRAASGGRPFMRIAPQGFEAAAVFRDVDMLAARSDVGARLRALAVEMRHDAPGRDYDAAERRWAFRAQGPRVDGRFQDGSRVRLDGRVLDLTLERPARERSDESGATADDGLVPASPARPLDATLMFETVSVDAERAPVMITEASGELVLEAAGDAPLTGRATVARAQIADRALLAQFAPLRLSFVGDIAEGAVSGASRVTLAASGRELAEADITYRWADGGRTGVARFSTPRLLLTPDRLQLVDVLPVMGRVVRSARGALQAEGEARFTAPDPEGTFARLDSASVTLTAADLALTTPMGRIEGAAATFRFADIIDPRTDGPQTITIASYDPGVAVRDLTLEVDLPGEGVITAPKVEGMLAGGAVSLSQLSLDWERRRAQGMASVSDLDLTRFGRALDLQGVTMTGRVSGAGAVSMDPLSLRFDEVRLAASEGGALLYEGDAQTWSDISYQTMAATLDGDLRNLTITIDAQTADGAEPVARALLVNAADILRRSNAPALRRR